MLLCSCALVEPDCSASCHGGSWKVTLEIGRDRDLVDNLSDPGRLLVAGSVSDYTGLWRGRWEGKGDAFMLGLEV